MVPTALFALVAAVGTASAQDTACSGIADCVVAPATPVVVVVMLVPTTYVVECPAGRTPAQVAVSTQPGVLYVDIAGNAYAPGVAATVPGAPRAFATSTVSDTVVSGTAGAEPSLWLNLFNTPYCNASTGSLWNDISVDGLSVSGSISTSGEQNATPVTSSAGSMFTAAAPPSAPTSISGPTSANDPRSPNFGDPFAPLSWQASLGGWIWMTAATMTPSIGCVTAPRKLVTYQRTNGDRDVPSGRAGHWLRCPVGTTRVGSLEHAVYVPGRKRLSLAERHAIDARLVTSVGGGQHVATRLGPAAPDGVRV